MKFSKTLVQRGFIMLITLIGLSSISLRAQQQLMEELPKDPQLVTGTLPNGLTYFIRHNENPKNRADFYIAQKVGSILEEDSQSGLAHFLEHMAFNGTKNFPGKKLINYLQSIGVKFGADLNAYTSFDETVYNVSDAPVDKKGVVDSCLLIMHDWSSNISLEGKEIDAERGVIHEEWRTRDNGNLRVYVKNLKAALPNNKYADRMPIGSMDVVDNFPHQVLRDYYHKWYRPDLQAIIVVGDIDAKEVEKKLKEIFKDIPKPVNAAERIYTKVEPNKEPLAGVATDPEATNTSLLITYKIEAFPKEVKNTQMGILIDFLSSIIPNMINNRLKEIYNKPNQPILGAFSYHDNYFVAQTMDAINFKAIVKEGAWKDALKTMTAEIEKVKRYGFTEGEYKRATKDFMVEIKNAYNERDKRKNEAIANEYISHFTKGGPLCDIETLYNMYKQISEQFPLKAVNMVAQDIFKKTQGEGIFLSGPEKKDLSYPTKEQLLKTWTEYQKLPVEPYKDKLSDAKLMDKIPQAGKIEKEESGMFGSKIWTLSNGAKVIVKKTDFKKDEISMKAYRPLGIFSLPEKDIYNGKFFNSVVNRGGLGKYSDDDLDKILSGHIASVSCSLTNSGSNLSGETTNSDLETMMQLLYLNFTSKRYDNDAFLATKEKFISSLKMKEANPMSSISDSIQESLYPNNLYHKALKEKDFDKIDYKRIMDIQKEYFNGANGFTFFFIGSFDEAKLKEYVETYIASLPKGTAPKGKNKSDAYVRKGFYDNIFKKKLTNPLAVVFNLYSGSLDNNIENTMKLDILSEVLDQVYTKSIREEEGGTYSVSTFSRIDIDPKNQATLGIYFQTSPEKALTLNNIVKDELKDLATKGADKEMFDNVIKNMYKNHAQVQKENRYWLSNLQQYYIWNIDNVTNWEKTIKTITPKSIGDIANKLIQQKNCTKVILYTEGHTLK